MDKDHRLQFWVNVKSDMRKAQASILKGYGLNWDTWKQLQNDIAHDGWQGEVQTERGLVTFVQKTYFAKQVAKHEFEVSQTTEPKLITER